MQETRYANCGSLLRGPRGLVFGYDDPVAVAKALVDFAETHAKLQIDGGAVEGQLIKPEQVKALAAMPGLRGAAGARRAPGADARAPRGRGGAVAGARASPGRSPV